MIILLTIVGMATFIGLLMFGILNLIVVGMCMSNKDKIKMYEEENIKIEEQIDTLVKQYMKYEGDTLRGRDQFKNW